MGMFATDAFEPQEFPEEHGDENDLLTRFEADKLTVHCSIGLKMCEQSTLGRPDLVSQLQIRSSDLVWRGSKSVKSRSSALCSIHRKDAIACI